VGGEEFKIGLLMVHAQDHLMTSILARELVEEMMYLLKR
jgi:PTS system cellobiose-specific IIA component